ISSDSNIGLWWIEYAVCSATVRLPPCARGAIIHREATWLPDARAPATVRPMAFPKRLLTTDEELVLDSRPHWIALVGPAFVAVLVLVAWILLLPKIHGHSTVKTVERIAILAVGAFLLLFYCLRTLIRWAT